MLQEARQQRRGGPVRAVDPAPPPASRLKALERVAPVAFVALAIGKLVSRFPGGREYQDLGSFLASGALYEAGKNPYEVPPLDTMGISGINFNPPLLLGIFGVLSRLPPDAVRLGLFLVQLAVIVTMLLWLRRGAPWWKVTFLLVAEPLWYGLWVGNFYPLLAILVVAANEFRDPRARGVAIGLLCAVKPNFLLWPILLLVAGESGAAAVALGTAGALSAVAGLWFGFGRYGDWLDAIAAWRYKVDAVTDLSLPGLARAAGHPGLAIVPVLAVLSVAVWAARRSRSAGEVAVLAALLVSPVAWVGYLVLIYPFLLDRPWRWPTIAALALTIPPSLVQPPGMELVFPPAGWYALAALLLFADAASTRLEDDVRR